jgi:hypothetical protein
MACAVCGEPNGDEFGFVVRVSGFAGDIAALAECFESLCGDPGFVSPFGARDVDDCA